jgi:hypothetical protein
MKKKKPKIQQFKKFFFSILSVEFKTMKISIAELSIPIQIMCPFSSLQQLY